MPEKKYCIVKGDSYLDHSLVIFCRDANETKKGRGELGGWRVCQVLATVELKMIDPTCKAFAWMSDSDTARIETDSIKLSKDRWSGTFGAGGTVRLRSRAVEPRRRGP